MRKFADMHDSSSQLGHSHVSMRLPRVLKLNPNLSTIFTYSIPVPAPVPVVVVVVPVRTRTGRPSRVIDRARERGPVLVQYSSL